MKSTSLILALRAVVNDKSGDSRLWNVLLPVIANMLRRERSSRDAEEARQEVCLKLVRTKSQVTGTTDGEANVFLRLVVRSIVVGAIRRRASRPMLVNTAPDAENDPYSTVATPEPEADVWDARAQIAEELMDRLRAEIEDRIVDNGQPLVKRELAWKQAQATLLARVGDGLGGVMGAKQIAEHLGVPGASAACIHKWVERGRPTVLEAIDALATDATADEAKWLDNLRGALAQRRKDAGAARPQRRKPEGKSK